MAQELLMADDFNDVVGDATAGKPVIILNGGGRGALVVPASAITADTVNFMARFARGLICLAMTRARADKLGIERQAQSRQFGPALDFGVSIEAREGVTTGISAYDRARTISVAANPASISVDLVSPGHVFPVLTHELGVFAELEHAEAAIDLARLAGFDRMAVVCEILNECGDIAKSTDLRELAKAHDLSCVSARKVAEWRVHNEPMIDLVSDADAGRWGDGWKLRHYRALDEREYVALHRGPAYSQTPAFVAWHEMSLFDELLGRAAGTERSLERLMQEANHQRPTIIVFAVPSNAASIGQGSATPAPAPLVDPSFIVQQILADICGRTVASPLSQNVPVRVVA